MGMDGVAPYYIGIDIGTSQSKGVIMDQSCRIVHQASVDHTMEHPQPGFYEHDAQQVWWGDFCILSRRLLEESGIDPAEIAGVGGSTLGSDCLPVDEACRPLRKAILYGIDARAQEEIRWLETLQDTRLFEEEYFLLVRNGKGGRERLSPIIGPNAGQIVERVRNTPAEERVWQFVHQCADIHSYRSDYAVAVYKAHARKIEDIPFDRVNEGTGRRYQSDVYTCRKDEAGKKLDKAAMLVCSKALGHNRISVVADNYIRGL